MGTKYAINNDLSRTISFSINLLATLRWYVDIYKQSTLMDHNGFVNTVTPPHGDPDLKI